MARMSREVLFGLDGAPGVLTAGYFLVADNDDLLAKEENQVSQEVKNSRSSGRYGHTFIFFHGGSWNTSGGRYSATGGAGVTRGGFGGIGAHTSSGA